MQLNATASHPKLFLGGETEFGEGKVRSLRPSLCHPPAGKIVDARDRDLPRRHRSPRVVDVGCSAARDGLACYSKSASAASLAVYGGRCALPYDVAELLPITGVPATYDDSLFLCVYGGESRPLTATPGAACEHPLYPFVASHVSIPSLSIATAESVRARRIRVPALANALRARARAQIAYIWSLGDRRMPLASFVAAVQKISVANALSGVVCALQAANVTSGLACVADDVPCTKLGALCIDKGLFAMVSRRCAHVALRRASA